MTTKISSLSLEYVKLRVDGRDVPTTSTVQIAFTAGAEPVEADWKPATWEVLNGRVSARVLVGPGGTVVLADGTWTAWVRFSVGVERPVLRAGEVIVT